MTAATTSFPIPLRRAGETLLAEPSLPQRAEGTPARACALATCRPGSRATVVDLGCAPDDACRLRALGICEGTNLSVVDSRHGMVLDVRGTRLALGAALTAGITVQPHPSAR